MAAQTAICQSIFVQFSLKYVDIKFRIYERLLSIRMCCLSIKQLFLYKQSQTSKGCRLDHIKLPFTKKHKKWET